MKAALVGVCRYCHAEHDPFESGEFDVCCRGECLDAAISEMYPTLEGATA